ncbi:MAG: hypothetical protein ABJB40_07975 [Acidobacteriota bacterium]
MNVKRYLYEFLLSDLSVPLGELCGKFQLNAEDTEICAEFTEFSTPNVRDAVLTGCRRCLSLFIHFALFGPVAQSSIYAVIQAGRWVIPRAVTVIRSMSAVIRKGARGTQKEQARVIIEPALLTFGPGP